MHAYTLAAQNEKYNGKQLFTFRFLTEMIYIIADLTEFTN